MSEELNVREEVGSVSVHVTKRSVHLAVRNILANEMRLDPNEIRNEVRTQAFALIKKEVIEYLEGKGYSALGLDDWAKRVLEHKKNEMEKLFSEIVKKIVRELVHETIKEEFEGVLEAVVRDGMELRIGWNRKAKLRAVKVEDKK